MICIIRIILVTNKYLIPQTKNTLFIEATLNAWHRLYTQQQSIQWSSSLYKCFQLLLRRNVRIVRKNERVSCGGEGGSRSTILMITRV